MTKEEIKQKCSLGVSEDINGMFYTIYDFDRMYEMFVAKSCEWLTDRLAFGVHPCNGTGVVMEYKMAMEEEKC